MHTLNSAVASISFDDVFKERNLELALEGDRWYDYVRVGYYNPDYAVNDIINQRRNVYDGGTTDLNDVYKNYYETGNWNIGSVVYNTDDRPVPGADAIRAMVKNFFICIIN